jgi:hypothetical protein
VEVDLEKGFPKTLELYLREWIPVQKLDYENYCVSVIGATIIDTLQKIVPKRIPPSSTLTNPTDEEGFRKVGNSR